MLLAGVADGASFLLDGQAALYVVAGVLALALGQRHRSATLVSPVRG